MEKQLAATGGVYFGEKVRYFLTPFDNFIRVSGDKSYLELTFSVGRGLQQHRTRTVSRKAG